MMPVLHARESLHRVHEMLYVSERKLPDDTAQAFLNELHSLARGKPFGADQLPARSSGRAGSEPLPFHARPDAPKPNRPSSMAEMLSLSSQQSPNLHVEEVELIDWNLVEAHDPLV